MEVTGPLKVETLDPALLKSIPALEGYGPDSLTESAYLFAHQGKQPCCCMRENKGPLSD